MADKLKCPFCGQELRFAATDVVWYCRKHGFLSGNEKLWQALIQSQHDLAKAIDALDTVRQHKRGTAAISPNDIAAYCDRVIAQITHDNKE